MIAKRLIPCLILQGDRLIHIKKFEKETIRYVGDPINVINIFNDYAVDEIIILDIFATISKKINYNLLKNLTEEAFFPMSYGGGINNIDDAKKLINIGFEKIIINNQFNKNSQIIKKCVTEFGSQSVILSLDLIYENNHYYIYDHINKKINRIKIQDLFLVIEDLGVGELMICCVDKDGTMSGFDNNLIDIIKNKISMPLIYKGGLKTYNDIKIILNKNVDAISSSSLFIMKKKDGGIVLNYPSENFKESL